MKQDVRPAIGFAHARRRHILRGHEHEGRMGHAISISLSGRRDRHAHEIFAPGKSGKVCPQLRISRVGEARDSISSPKRQCMISNLDKLKRRCRPER